MDGMTTVTQGTVGLGMAVGHFCSKGYSVSLPLNDNQSYDLVVDGGTLKRVQVKTTRAKSNSGKFVVQLKSVRSNKTENVIKTFDKGSAELLFIFTADGEKYCIPTSELEATSTMTLDMRYDKYRVS